MVCRIQEDKYRSKLEAVRTHVKQLDVGIVSRNNQIELLKKKVSTLSGDTNSLRSQITAKDNELIELRKQIEDQKKELDKRRDFDLDFWRRNQQSF